MLDKLHCALPLAQFVCRKVAYMRGNCGGGGGGWGGGVLGLCQV